MPGNGAYVFTEPGDYEASIRDEKIELVVTGSGPFKAAVTKSDLGQLQLLRSREDQASVAFFGLRADLVFVTFPTHFNPPPVWGGQELRPGDIVFHGLGERMHQRTAGSSEKGFVALTPERLAFWSHTLADAELLPPPSARIVRPSASATKRLLSLHTTACRLVEESPDTIAHPEVTRALEQELIHALVNCLSPNAPSQIRPLGTRRAAVMRRFEETLAAHPDQSLHIPQLCMAIGVSERTLRASCAEFLGMSPGWYLRLRRLKLVRTALLRPNLTTISVAGTARRYGFGEPGRFACMYRAVYGEAPSATLRLRRHQGQQM